MPPKIKRLWVFCVIVLFFGFVVLSMQKKIDEARQKAEQQEKMRSTQKPVGQNEPLPPDPIQEIKELNALGKHNKAVELASQVAALNPQNARVQTWWGISLVKAGRRNEAIERFIISSQMDPTHAQTFVYWGLTLAMDQRHQEAAAKYRAAIELDPENSGAYAYLGAALIQLKQYREAVDMLNRSIDLNPLNSTAPGLLVDAYYYLEEYDKAWKVVSQARKSQVSIPGASLKRLDEAMPEPVSER